MRSFSQGTLEVFTFKEGLLSVVAHDLRLSLRRFTIEVDQDRVQGHFSLASLEIDGAVRGGKVESGVLSAKDLKEIRRNMDDKVLHIRKHPEVTFEGRVTSRPANRVQVDGKFHLHGRQQALGIETIVEQGRARGKITLQPSRWGIPPFKALLGAIRLQDRVEIRWDLKES